MQDRAPTGADTPHTDPGASRARALLAAGATARARVSGTSASATGRITVAAAVLFVCLFTEMASRGRSGGLLLTVLLVALPLAFVACALAARHVRTALPLGWSRRLWLSTTPLILVPWVLSAFTVLGGVRPELPIWLAASAGVLLAAPLAANGLWLVRRGAPPSHPDAERSRAPATAVDAARTNTSGEDPDGVAPAGTPAAANPFVVLAALREVDSVGLRTLRSAVSMPGQELDRILRDFDDRDLLDLGWGGTIPGRNTPVALTPTGRTAHDDLLVRLTREADGTGG